MKGLEAILPTTNRDGDLVRRKVLVMSDPFRPIEPINNDVFYSTDIKASGKHSLDMGMHVIIMHLDESKNESGLELPDWRVFDVVQVYKLWVLKSVSVATIRQQMGLVE